MTDGNYAPEVDAAFEMMKAGRVVPLLLECMKNSTRLNLAQMTFVEAVGGMFCIDKCEAHKRKPQIIALIEELVPEEFYAGSEGNGGSLMVLVFDKSGKRWTQFEAEAEMLYVLAASVGLAELCMPRAAWFLMPGGRPMIRFFRSSRMN